MALNNYFDNTDINVYFHMKNHYKKLRSARSTIDNSFPQSFVKILPTPPSSGRSLNRTVFEERHNNEPHLSNRSTIVRKQNCNSSISGTSDTSVNTIKLPLRPKTRRNLYEMPFKIQYKPRSQSVGSTNRKNISIGLNKKRREKSFMESKNNIGDRNSESNSKTDVIDQYKNEEHESCHNISPKDIQDKVSSNSRVEEHEYLQFLLRITEDIIINNLYANEDIEKVFQVHIEANKDHLKVEKMEARLATLCTELEIPYKNKENDEKNLEHYKHFFDYHTSKSDIDQSLQDCECTTKRTLNMAIKDETFDTKGRKRDQESESDFKRMFNMIANKCSLDRVTECTETSNSLDTLIGYIKQLSITNVSSSGNTNMVRCLESLESSSASLKEELCQNDALSRTGEKILICELSLTEKEKLGCVEEEILFHKQNSNLINDLEDINLNEIKSLTNQSTNSIENNHQSETVNLKIPEEALVLNVTDEIKEQSGIEVNFPDNDVNKVIENLNTSCPKNTEQFLVEEKLGIHFNIPDNNFNLLIENLSMTCFKNLEENNREPKSDTHLIVPDNDMRLNSAEQSDLEEKSNARLNISDNEINKLVENLSVPLLKNEETIISKGIADNDVNKLIENLKVHLENPDKSFLKGLSIEHSENKEQNDSESACILKYNEVQNYATKDATLKSIPFNVKATAEEKAVTENMNKLTNDQYTQIELMHSDKECNTTINLDEYMKSDYVLLNGPIYVLKSIVDSEDKLIIYDKESNRNNNFFKERLSHDKATSLQHYNTISVIQPQTKLDYIPSHCEGDFSKLLNSDYDLMPQRDSDTSNNNYHHLLVDATTSISNTNLEQSINNVFANSDALLLSDKYELFGQTQVDEEQIPETDNSKNHQFQKHISQTTSNQFELGNYSLSNEESNSINNSSYSISSKAGVAFQEQMPELDVSLTDYELFSNNIPRQSNIVNKDGSESGEIVRARICTDEKISHDLILRSDKEENSSTSSPRRSNILGKRKLKHPS